MRGFAFLKPGSVLLSHGISHTIIGAERFHFRVRNGIGWFTLAIAARQTGMKNGVRVKLSPTATSQNGIARHNSTLTPFFIRKVVKVSGLLRLEPSPKSLGCYMVKPHGQLVLVSFIRYRTSTPSLSTWWSSTALQGPQGSSETSS